MSDPTSCALRRSPSPGRRRRSGATLLEASLVLTLLAILAGISVRGFTSQRDGARVRAAGTGVRAFLQEARGLAQASGRSTAVRFDERAARLIVHAETDTALVLPLARWGVTLATTRDSVAWRPSGLGYGAANVRLIVSRGAHADTVRLSRLGRVR